MVNSKTLTRNISHSMPLSTEPCDQHFIVFLDEVETAVVGDKGSDLLPVLDQLHTDTLADSGVRLLGLDTSVRVKGTEGCVCKNGWNMQGSGPDCKVGGVGG